MPMKLKEQFFRFKENNNCGSSSASLQSSKDEFAKGKDSGNLKSKGYLLYLAEGKQYYSFSSSHLLCN